MLAGITALAVMGRLFMHGSGFRGRGSGGGGLALALVAFGLTSLVVGYVGVFFARMIKASVSRQREYLADASAMQDTRQTAGLAGALKKIGGLDEGSKLENARAETVSHMLFGDGVRMSRWVATHPPLVDRSPSWSPASPRTASRI